MGSTLKAPIPTLFKDTTVHDVANQMDSFTDIVDTRQLETLKNQLKQINSPTRSQALDLAMIASPLGPSQVDIANLAAKKDLPSFLTQNPPILRRAIHNSERRACSAMMVKRDPPTIFLNEKTTRNLRFETDDKDSDEHDKVFQVCKVGRQERSASLPSADISVS